RLSVIMSSEEKALTLNEIIDEIQPDDPEYYKTRKEWSLITFLLYRQQCTDFVLDKSEEHDRYAYSLSKIIGWEQVPRALLTQSLNALNSFQKEKKSAAVVEFWANALSSQKRKFEALSERSAILEEHVNTIMKISSQQEIIVREDFTNQLENKAGSSSSQKRLCTTGKKKELVAQETELVTQETEVSQEETLNSVTETSNIFRDVQFPEYYNKLKTIWQTREPDAGYYVIDLSDKEILNKVHDLLDINELKLLFNKMTMVDENKSLSEKARQYLNLFDQIMPFSDNGDEDSDIKIDDETVLKIANDIKNLSGLATKFKYLSYTLPVPINEYDESIYPEIHIISSISRHLSAISKMDRITRQISTKFDLQNVDYKADGVAELFERPKQIPIFILEVSGDPDNPDLDKYNDDRKKLMKEGVFALNKFITGTKFPTWETCESLGVFLAQGFQNNLEIGQMVFIGPGLYLFSPFTVPNLTIPSSPFELEHSPRLIRTLLYVRVAPVPGIVTFDKFLPRVLNDKTKNEHANGNKGRGREDKTNHEQAKGTKGKGCGNKTSNEKENGTKGRGRANDEREYAPNVQIENSDKATCSDENKGEIGHSVIKLLNSILMDEEDDMHNVVKYTEAQRGETDSFANKINDSTFIQDLHTEYIFNAHEEIRQGIIDAFYEYSKWRSGGFVPHTETTQPDQLQITIYETLLEKSDLSELQNNELYVPKHRFTNIHGFAGMIITIPEVSNPDADLVDLLHKILEKDPEKRIIMSTIRKELLNKSNFVPLVKPLGDQSVQESLSNELKRHLLTYCEVESRNLTSQQSEIDSSPMKLQLSSQLPVPTVLSLLSSNQQSVVSTGMEQNESSRLSLVKVMSESGYNCCSSVLKSGDIREDDVAKALGIIANSHTSSEDGVANWNQTPDHDS
ncbi:16036_t:CDS:10, partial [Gigaspora margarita]